MTARLPAALLLASLALPARAAFNSGATGTTALESLQLGASARAEALGGAYAAAADGADALYWNPAGLSRVAGGEATLMHAPYVDSSYYDYAAIAQRAGPGVAAGGAQYFTAGSVSETDINGAGIGNTTPYDLALSAGYGLEVPGDGPLAGAAVGAAGKFIQSRLATRAQTAAADLGTLSPALLDGRLRFALTARNVGGTIKYDAARENLPLTTALGAAYRLGERWLLVAQTQFARDASPEFMGGAEYRMPAGEGIELAGRLGARTAFIGQVAGLAGLTAGGGLTFRAASFDYAFVPLGDLGLTHRLSLTLRWGAPAREAAQARPAPAAAKAEPPSPPAPADAKAPADPFEQHAFAARGQESLHDYAKASEEWLAAEAALPADDPRRMYVEVALGDDAVRAGEPDAATAHYLSSIQFGKSRGVSDRSFMAAYVGLADRLAAKGRKDAALRNYRKALTLTNDKGLQDRINARIAKLEAPADEPPAAPVTP